MEENIDYFEDAFGKSKKNEFDEYSDYLPELELKAIIQAEKLKEYTYSTELKKLFHRNLIIHSKTGIDYKFQSTSLIFHKSNGDFCTAEFSVPISFNGPIRLWTEDIRGKKVWSTMDKIIEMNCDSTLLFNFLGKYYDRFTQDQVDYSLPFKS